MAGSASWNTSNDRKLHKHETEWQVGRATPDYIRAVVGFLECIGCRNLASGARNSGATPGVAPLPAINITAKLTINSV